MDLGAAERMAAVADPRAVAALQKHSRDPAVAKAVAEQFGTLLLQRAMQNGDGQAMNMVGGVGGKIVNAMFSSAVAQSAMSGDRLGLADLLFRSMEAKQQSASGGTAAAAPAAAAPTAAASGFPLSPYWQGHGLRPFAAGVAHAAIPSQNGLALPPRQPAGPVPANNAVSPSAHAEPAQSESVHTAADGAAHAEINAFSARLAPLLQQAAQQLGVSPRVLLAQAALETGWGRSVVGNNIFGIKAGGSWSGAAVSAATHEIENGQSVPQVASFRAYDSLDAAVRDFVSLVGRSSRYRAALGTGDDARAYATALIAGGYATDDRYPEKLAAVAASPSVTAAFAPAAPSSRPSFFDAGT